MTVNIEVWLTDTAKYNNNIRPNVDGIIKLTDYFRNYAASDIVATFNLIFVKK